MSHLTAYPKLPVPYDLERAGWATRQVEVKRRKKMNYTVAEERRYNERSTVERQWADQGWDLVAA